MTRAWCLCLLVPLAACGGSSPAAPSPSGGGSVAFQGQTVSAIDGAPVSSVTVQLNGLGSATSDSSGLFKIDVAAPGSYHVTLHGTNTIDRDTNATSGEGMRLSLIPASFNLAAFDEMARTSNSRLQRWTTTPSLVILASVMTYRADGGDSYTATAETLSDDEVTLLQSHLAEGLGVLAGGAYGSFASVTIERPAAGASVNVLRTGTIVVGRYNGVSNATQVIGYGQWATDSAGNVGGGSMFLDRDFDKNNAQRRLLRIHELGHALGYTHVQATPSIMRPVLGPDITDFDRTAARIAYQRPVGNRSPDADPRTLTLNLATEGGFRWSPPAICR